RGASCRLLSERMGRWLRGGAYLRSLEELARRAAGDRPRARGHRDAGRGPPATQLACIEAQLCHVDGNGQPAIATWLLPAAEGRGPTVIATFGADGSERGPFPPPSSGGPARHGDDHD